MTENKRFECVQGYNDRYIRDNTNNDLMNWQKTSKVLNALYEENEQLKFELLCKQLDKAPTEPINCKCYYKELKE